MKRKIILAGAVALAMSMSACGGGGGAATGGAKAGGTLNLAVSQPLKTWDLAEAGMGNAEQYYEPVFDSLLHMDSKGTPTANLATSWAYDAALTTLTLKLRTDVKFSDGTPLDADAVKANLLHTKAGKSEAAALVKAISDVQVTDASTVLVKLSTPSPSLLRSLANVPGMIASPKSLTSPQVPIGSGPYTVDTATTTAGTEYGFVANPNYWNKNAYPFEKVDIKTMSDPTARTNALLSGQLDGAGVSPDRVDAVKAGGLKIDTVTPGVVEGLYIWDRKGTIVPALADVRVRQALNYAFDSASIVKIAKKGLGTPTTQHFTPDSEAFVPELDETYKYDPAKAKALLAEAGYANGFDVVMPDISSLFPEMQAAMVEQLGNVGVRVKLDKIPFDQFMPSILAGKYAMSYFKTGGADPWIAIQLIVAKQATWNPLHYEDQHVTDLMSRISTSTGSAQTDLYKELNTYLVKQAWDAPWDVVKDVYASSKNVQVTMHPFYQTPPLYNFKPAS
jgi:peptide/nickel transport system substrate-binding protein